MNWLDYFHGRSVLVTGHTGFKGGWLATWLKELGAHVTGLALDPPAGEPSLFELADVADGMESRIADIRDLAAVRGIVRESEPAVVFHLAAQPLVRESYSDPVRTYATNVLGTVHVLEAVREVDSVRCVVNVTTDKCYENRGWPWGYREIDALGGHDPYSSSKAASEIVTAAYRSSFFSDPASPRVATARAGNVIGGGDWAADRLVPDVVRALSEGRRILVRNPGAVRPWQHVLDPLGGYLLLAARLAGEEGERFAGPWNFGPSRDSAVSVSELLERLDRAWPERSIERDEQPGTQGPHEARFLQLDIAKAMHELGWRPAWDLDAAVKATAAWYQAYLDGAGARGRAPSLARLTSEQIRDYTSCLNASGGETDHAG